MTSVSVTAGETITAAQYILMMLQTYTGYGDYLCPPTSMTVTADTAAATTYDYIVVGAGTAGSVMTYRLSECTNKTTLLIEDGPCAPLESLSPGLFTMLPQSVYDRNYTFVNDSYSCQNQQPQGGPTAAYMFGGTGALNHMIHVRACDADLNRWCAAANDSSWCADEMNKYMAKSEALFDSSVSDQNSYVHGTDGCVGLTRQTSSYIDFVLEGANELDIPTTNDTLPASAKYANFPLLAIANGTRTYGNAGCLKETLTRTNVKYLAGHVNKVNFDGTVATGVQVTVSGVTYNITAGKVIMTTGALQTPIVLMNSGVGDATTLSASGIDPVVNNSDVGKNLRDHLATPFIISFNESASPTLSGDPHEFPVPTVTLYQAFNSSQSYPDCQNIALLFPANSSGFLQLCYNVFKYKADICDKAYGLYKPLLFNVLNLLNPDSVGSVSLNTTDTYGSPIIKSGLLSNSSDLTNAAACLSLSAAIVNTTAFQSKGAEFVDLGLCSDYTFNTTEYWQCYAVAMSSTMWHYSGTCSLGKVVDSSLNVTGTTNLKVCDGSAMPFLTCGNINSPIQGIAEKCADIVKTEDGCST